MDEICSIHMIVTTAQRDGLTEVARRHGIITANLTNRYRSLHMPKPRAIFLDDPHDSGLNGYGEPSLDDSLAGIPSTVLFQCHSGANGVISEPNKANSSCNAVFPKLKQIPKRNKDLVLTQTDTHGAPGLSSAHGVCAGGPGFGGPPNAYDWNFCWKEHPSVSARSAGISRVVATRNTGPASSLATVTPRAQYCSASRN